MLKKIVIAAACLATTPAMAADVFGHWLVESKKAVVEIKPCGALACGEVVWMSSDSTLTQDENNPDEAMRGRPMCGLPLIGNFESDGRGGWKNGFIYDPTEGKTYKSKMSLKSDNELSVRGYVGVPMFGKSQIWTRADGAGEGC